jgi:hypothetical protein
MKRVAGVLRLAVFAAALAVLPSGEPAPYAQQWMGYWCVTFLKETLDCPSNCQYATKSFENMIYGLDRPYGIDNPFLMDYDCGTPLPNCPVQCSGQYFEAVPQANECCVQAVGPETYCDSYLPCCVPHICQSNTCCVPKWQHCETGADCCSGACNDQCICM